MKTYKIFPIFLFCHLFLFLHTANADTFSIVFENDLFAKKDGGYTSGIRIGWLEDEAYEDDINGSKNRYTSFMENTVELIPFVNLDSKRKHDAGISLYQMMYTPEDIANTHPDYDDIPYSGSLLASFFLFEFDHETYHEYSFDIGLVGPNSGAEEVQKIVHKATGNTEPKGWDNQLSDKLMIGAAYGYGKKNWKRHYENDLDSDWVNAFRCQLGNFYTGVYVSTLWRFGNNYPENFNTNFPGTMGNTAFLTSYKDNKRFGWSLSAGFSADAIAYLYVIDSAKDYNLDRNIYSASLIGMASLHYETFALLFSMRRSTAFIQQSSSETVSFGTVSLLWNF